MRTEAHVAIWAVIIGLFAASISEIKERLQEKLVGLGIPLTDAQYNALALYLPFGVLGIYFLYLAHPFLEKSFVNLKQKITSKIYFQLPFGFQDRRGIDSAEIKDDKSKGFFDTSGLSEVERMLLVLIKKAAKQRVSMNEFQLKRAMQEVLNLSEAKTEIVYLKCVSNRLVIFTQNIAHANRHYLAQIPDHQFEGIWDSIPPDLRKYHRSSL